MTNSFRCGLVIWSMSLFVLTACRPPGPAVPWEATPERTRAFPVSTTPAPVPEVSLSSSPALVSEAPATPTSVSGTGSSYADLTIEALSSRSYGGGQIRVVEALGENQAFTRQLIVYPSEGLQIYGFLNRPKGAGPYPVVIALHGYVDPGGYETLDYTTRYADALAQAGFVVLHPNLRGFPPSDGGPNLFRVGMAVDVLNLIALVRQQAGQPGPLENATGDAIGLWGHSMGGGVSLRVLVASPEVAGAVLYGSMSGDEVRNFSKILEWSEGVRGWEELAVPDTVVAEISPINYLHRIQAALSVHHGEADELVPPEWSLELCERLSGLQAQIDCYTYPGQPHTFYGDADQLFVTRSVDFFRRHLVGP